MRPAVIAPPQYLLMKGSGRERSGVKSSKGSFGIVGPVAILIGYLTLDQAFACFACSVCWVAHGHNLKLNNQIAFINYITCLFKIKFNLFLIHLQCKI